MVPEEMVSIQIKKGTTGVTLALNALALCAAAVCARKAADRA